MQYTLSTNFDDHLIEQIAGFGCVASVYGKFRSDIIGGGRPAHLLPRVSWKALETHIACCHRHGIKFDYLLNSICIGNREVTPVYHRIIRFVERLVRAGIDEVTLSNTTLIRMVRKRFPDLRIVASIFLGIRDPAGIKRYEDEGVNDITMHSSVNRDWQALAEIVERARPEMGIRLVANNTCVKHCIDAPNHANFSSHGSQGKRGSPAYTLDPYKLHCEYQKLKNPTLYLSSEWIRPEDTHYYDDFGKGRISLKLTDRTAPTEWLVNLVQAYAGGKSGTNAMDVLNHPGNRALAQLDKGAIVKGILKGNIRGRQMRDMAKILKVMPVFLDNAKLEGFLEGMQKIDCRNAWCDDRDWLDMSASGGGCGYCRSFAKKAITINEPERRKLLVLYEQKLSDLYGGRLF
jgi:collagenase-like PrtC family protease